MIIGSDTLRKKRADHRFMHTSLVLQVVHISSAIPVFASRSWSGQIDQPWLTSTRDEREILRWWLNIEHPVGRLQLQCRDGLSNFSFTNNYRIAYSGPPAWKHRG